ncbi:MAG: hypothetical protein MW690_000011 [Methanophagales archaeon]|nr:hypothetical protein [Methanophagales archaeon]
MKSPSKEAVKKPAVRKTTKGSSGVIHTSFTIPLFAASSICLKYSSEGSKPPQTYLHFALFASGAVGAVRCGRCMHKSEEFSISQ